MLISQPISRCLTNHRELCMSRLLNNQRRRISIYRLQRRPSFGFESSVSSTPMTSGDPVFKRAERCCEILRESVTQLKLENYRCYVYYSVAARECSREQTTTHTTTNTQTTKIVQDGGPGSAILLQSDGDVTSGSSDFRSWTPPRRRKPSEVVRAEDWCTRVPTADGAVASFSQTFPAGTRAGVTAVNPASWRHEFNGITCVRFTQQIVQF